jgi:hypothetical protein
MTITDTTIQPVDFTPPLLNPYPGGLYAATVWDDSTNSPPRWLNGLRFLPGNFVADSGLGYQTLDSWCDEFDKSAGARPEPGEPFDAVLIWAADQCDMTPESQGEVRDNVAQTLRLNETRVVELAFGARLAADADAFHADDLTEAVGYLDDALATAGIGGGLIHAAAGLSAELADANLARFNGSRAYSPLGNVYVFGAGYTDVLTDTLVATTPTFGWRTPVEIREAFDPASNTFYAMAERSVLVGYERLIAAATTEETGP